MTADPRSPAPLRRSRFIRAIVLAALASVVAAYALGACSDRCSNGQCSEISEARFLDRVCQQRVEGKPACEVGPGVRMSTGITADTIGFFFDEKGGTLIFHLEAIEGARSGDNFDVEILAASIDPDGSTLDSDLSWGSCATGCPPDPNTFSIARLPTSYTWVPVLIGQKSAETSSPLPYDAVLALSGKSIDIADLRISSNTPVGSCSVARPIGAR